MEASIQAVIPLVSLIRPSWAPILFGAEVLGIASLHVLSAYQGRPLFQRSTAMPPLVSRRIPVITAVRAIVLLGTILAILAVDFRTFPRRFAKTEVSGVSLMDAGVGAFVLVNALVAKQARQQQSQSDPEGTSASSESHLRVRPLGRRLRAVVATMTPVCVLGFARLATVKGVDYHEHVTEYGVHWNFFFSLVGVALLSETLEWVLDTLFPPKRESLRHRPWLFIASGLAIATAYQVWLTWGAGAEMILHAPRTTLFLQNREGMMGLIGFSALYLIGVGVGGHLHAHAGRRGKTTAPSLLWILGALTCASMATAFTFHSLVDPVSRRLVNLPYVIWIVSLGCGLLLLLTAFDWMLVQTKKNPAVSALAEALNRNALPVFLLANMFTGAVNFFIDTLSVTDGGATGILLVYVGFVTFVAMLFQNRTLRFW